MRDREHEHRRIQIGPGFFGTLIIVLIILAILGFVSWEVIGFAVALWIGICCLLPIAVVVIVVLVVILLRVFDII
ncbi:MAG: hypothetical protein ACMUIE_02645 [Thermoplasmatota archaeon]